MELLEQVRPMSDDDPFLWLEEIEGEAALAWVARQNARTLGRARKRSAFRRALSRRARCADVRRPHPLSGVSRRSARQFLAGRDACPRALARDEPRLVSDTGTGLADAARHRCAVGRAKGATGCFTAPRPLPPDYRRALVSLSDGGKDAAERREFDIDAGEFVEGGFFLPEGKQSAVWLDADTLLVARDWGPGTMTRSGYPFVLKRLGRSMPLDSAVEIFRGSPEDVSVGASVLRDPDGTVRGILINRQVSFFDSEWHLLDAAGPIRLPLPARSSFRGFVVGQLIFSLEEAWEREGHSGRRAGLARPRRVPRGAAECGACNHRGAGRARSDRGCRDDAEPICW